MRGDLVGGVRFWVYGKQGQKCFAGGEGHWLQGAFEVLLDFL